MDMKQPYQETATRACVFMATVVAILQLAFVTGATFVVPQNPSLNILNPRHYISPYKSKSTATALQFAMRSSKPTPKESLNDIVKGMGLQTVTTTKKASHSDNGTFSSEELLGIPNLVKPASSISIDTQLSFSRNGHAVLRNFVDPVVLMNIRKELEALMSEEEILAWRQKIQVASNSEKRASACKTVQDCQAELRRLGITESLPFLQHFNTFRKLRTVKTLALSLGEAASILLDVPTVRLYQDSVFWKRMGDGPTPWHVDARMAPFDTSHFVTFWLPLQNVPKDGTALLFCSKSHADFALPYWNSMEKSQDEDSEWNRLENRYPKDPVHYMPMQVGDLTVHAGWTLHCADGAHRGSNSVDRMALAISFVDAKAQLRQDAMDDKGLGDNEDRWSYHEWVQAVHPRKPFRHGMVPIVWPR